MWWWWPTSAGTEFLSFLPRALIKSLSANEMNLLLDDIPERVRKKWGVRGSLLLHQLFGGANVILINRNGAALAMDTVWTVGSSAADDMEFARSRGIDTNKHTYLFKAKLLPLAQLFVYQPLQGISDKDFECVVCQDIAEEAVHCIRCENILCKNHLSKISRCSLCKSTPFETHTNEYVRRLISKLQVTCPECKAPIARGDLSTHQKQFCLKRKGAESSCTEDSPKEISSALTSSESMATGEQQVKNAIGVTREEFASSQFELTSEAKTHDWNSQSDWNRKLRDFIAKLKCAQINEFDVLLEINIYIDACLSLESEKSKSQVPPIEMFKFLSVSIDALMAASTQLRSSPDFDFLSQKQDIASHNPATLDLSVDTLNAQCQRAEETLSSLRYLLRRLLTTSKTDEEVSVDNGSNESGISDVVNMTRTLFKELAELANGGKTERNRSMVIAEMTDKLDEYRQKFTSAVLRQTGEFKSILAAMECKRNSSSNDIVETPTKELIRQTLESFRDLQRSLTNLNVLLIRSSNKDSSSFTTSLTFPTNFESPTGIHEECQLAITALSTLIFQLNSTVCSECPQLRSVLAKTNVADFDKCVLQRIMKLCQMLGEIARSESKICAIKQFLNEMANAILDCYNFILHTSTVFKYSYVGSETVEQEYQNSDLSKRFEAIQSELLDFQQQNIFYKNLVQDLECVLCKELAENAVHCTRCKKILCKSHFLLLKQCPSPYCNSVLL